MNTLPSLALVAAIAAFVVSPATILFTGPAWFALSFLTLVVSDYQSRHRLARRFAVAGRERYRLAA